MTTLRHLESGARFTAYAVVDGTSLFWHVFPQGADYGFKIAGGDLGARGFEVVEEAVRA